MSGSHERILDLLPGYSVHVTSDTVWASVEPSFQRISIHPDVLRMSDVSVAAVLAHEAAHVLLGHHRPRLWLDAGYMLITLAAAVLVSSLLSFAAALATLALLALLSWLAGFAQSRMNEYRADRKAAQLLNELGITPDGYRAMGLSLSDAKDYRVILPLPCLPTSSSALSRLLAYFRYQWRIALSSHPPIDRRIRRLTRLSRCLRTYQVGAQ